MRVLEYTDRPGDRTTPHEHPDSVMYTLSAFRRRLHSGGTQRDVEMPAGTTAWLPAQQHAARTPGTPRGTRSSSSSRRPGHAGTSPRPRLTRHHRAGDLPRRFPRGIGRPATGALLAAGYTDLPSSTAWRRRTCSACTGSARRRSPSSARRWRPGGCRSAERSAKKSLQRTLCGLPSAAWPTRLPADRSTSRTSARCARSPIPSA